MSYLSPQLEALSSDVVYRCQIKGNDGYMPILILTEHQSTADEHIAFRMIQYTTHLMDDHLKGGHKRLPLVLPLCMYHGEKSPFPHSCDIYDDFEDVTLARALFFRPFQLIDLTIISIEILDQHGTAALMEILFKQSQDKQWLLKIKELSKQGTIQFVIRSTSGAYLTSTLSYVLSQEDDKQKQSTDELIREFTTTLPEREKEIMTFATTVRK